jgi:hypothetical protein
VTGAISLLQQRCGWLKQKPRETADIILQSATDLGAPGVDPVYGHGLLNITASQAPLDYSKLYPKVTKNGFGLKCRRRDKISPKIKLNLVY